MKTLDLGYRPDEIAVIEIRPAAGGYTGASANQFYARIVEHVRALPGVKGAATAFGINFAGGFKVKLDAQPESGGMREANIYGVNPGYFDTFGARVLAGRDFNTADAAAKRQVYIVSEHLAKTYFRGEDPVAVL